MYESSYVVQCDLIRGKRVKFLNKMLFVSLSIFTFTSISVNAEATSTMSIDEKERMAKKVVRVKTDLENSPTGKNMKHIEIETVELVDNQGLKYVGGKVSKASLSVYLEQMNTLLGDDYIEFREGQVKRDHNTFHMTLINPYEFQALKQNVNFGEKMSVTLLGLGRVEKDNKATYFVVAQSPQAQYFRQKLSLSAKDFHVTLGFNPSDIYGVKKDETSLIQ